MTFKRNRYDHASNFIEDACAYAAHLHMRYGTSDHMTDYERDREDALREDAEDARREILREERDAMVDPDDETLCDCGEGKPTAEPVCALCAHKSEGWRESWL